MFIKFLALGLAALTLSACTPVVRKVSGELHGDQTWRGTVFINGDVFVPKDVLLRIEAGTCVVFENPSPGRDVLRTHPNFPGSELIVRGRLVAMGTMTEPIRFRNADPDAAAGGWGGINLEAGSQAHLRYCSFRQADSALHSREANVTIENCNFENNLVGVRFHSSQITVRNSSFLDNGTAIRFHFGAPVIDHNLFRRNRKALFITSHPANYLIAKNNFFDSDEYHVVLGEEVPEDVELTDNYWGTSDGGQVVNCFYDGRRSDYLGIVRFKPFLSTPVKNAGASWSL